MCESSSRRLCTLLAVLVGATATVEPQTHAPIRCSGTSCVHPRLARACTRSRTLLRNVHCHILFQVGNDRNHCGAQSTSASCCACISESASAACRTLVRFFLEVLVACFPSSIGQTVPQCGVSSWTCHARGAVQSRASTFAPVRHLSHLLCVLRHLSPAHIRSARRSHGGCGCSIAPPSLCARRSCGARVTDCGGGGEHAAACSGAVVLSAAASPAPRRSIHVLWRLFALCSPVNGGHG